MKISTTIEIELPNKVTISNLEKIIFKTIWKAAKDLFIASLSVIEQSAFEANKKTVAKQKIQRRWLLTRFGWIKFSRYKVRFKKEAKYGYLLDNVLIIKGQKTARQVKITLRNISLPSSCLFFLL